MSRYTEIEVAVHVGLDTTLGLTQACADFYLLERMYSDHYGMTEDTRNDGVTFSKVFGRGGRTELQAYQSKMLMADLETTLAHQFSIYIAMACGGELRYFRETYSPYNEFYCIPDDAELLCVTDKLRIDGHKYSNRWHTADCLADKTVARQLTDKDFGYVGTVKKYLSDEQFREGHRGERHAGWDLWMTVLGKTKDRAKAMRQCAAALDAPIWYRTGKGLVRESDPGLPLQWSKDDPVVPHKGSTSIGGRKWATAASICASYLEGEMTPRTFVDRCWSLQHNGGSLFNKLWDTNHLMATLVKQAEGDYSVLAGYSSTPVRQLWIESTWQPGMPWPVTKLSPLDAAKSSNPWPGEDTGCLYCYEHWLTTGSIDQCGNEDSGIPNESCGYSPDNYDGDGGTVCNSCGDPASGSTDFCEECSLCAGCHE